MWVRSQDKKTLVKVDKLIIAYDTDEKIYEIHNVYDSLGTYNTKERAIEVLDEIQKKINDIKKDFLMACMREKGVYDVIAWNDFVYKMPKE